MLNLMPGNHRHLTLKDREHIKKSLHEGRSFKETAKYFRKIPSPFPKKFGAQKLNAWDRGNFNNPYYFCIHRFRCKKTNAWTRSLSVTRPF